VAGTDNHAYTVNVGLYTTTVDVTGAAEGDLWYNSTEKVAKVSLADNKIGHVGPQGTHPIIYDVANAWYPMYPAQLLTNLVVTNNRAYAFPFHVSRECNLTGLSINVATGGTGNGHMGMYSSHPTTFLPDLFVNDIGSVSVAGTGNIEGWAVNEVMEPALYWLVFVPQTTVAPSVKASVTTNTYVPVQIATPTFVTAEQANCLYSDTGFSGAFPVSFGAVAGSTYGPLIYVKLI
jgi:hypothetical protein